MPGRTAEPLEGRRVLIVEDDYLIASDLVRSLAERGANVVGPVNSVAGALARIADGADIETAVLDINLGRERAYPVADALMARGVPFVFATGYDDRIIPEKYSGVPRCEKPIDMRRLVRLLAVTTPAAN